MALIDVKCANNHIHEVYRGAADWPSTPACPDCGAPTEQVHLPKAVRWTPEPVVVFKAGDGTFRFPGDPNGLSAKTYEKQGFQRVEIRGAAEMRSFEKQMNKREYAAISRRVEAKARQREEATAQRNSEIRRSMEQGFSVPEIDRERYQQTGEVHYTGRRETVRLSERGKAIMRSSIARGEARPAHRAADPNFISEAYSFDRGSREASRDAEGRRRRD